jgi:hypothetical protein
MTNPDAYPAWRALAHHELRQRGVRPTSIPEHVLIQAYVRGTKAQWDKMIQVVAELARHYRIPITPKTVLTHAEVQSNFGIAQRGKWDITRLPFDLLGSPNKTRALRISRSPGSSTASLGSLTPRLLSNRRALLAIWSSFSRNLDGAIRAGRLLFSRYQRAGASN